MAKAATKLQLSETEERLQAIYGPTMLLDELAEVIGMTVGSIYTLRSVGQFSIPLFRPTRRKLIAFTRDVADHLDRQREIHLKADKHLLDLIHS